MISRDAGHFRKPDERWNPEVFDRLHRSKKHWIPVSTGVTGSEDLRKHY